MEKCKIDNYTRAILTIIATCLAVLTVDQLEIVPRALAEINVSKPSLSTINYGLVPLNEDGSINVRFDQSHILNVNLVGIDNDFGSVDGLEIKWDPISVETR